MDKVLLIPRRRWPRPALWLDAGDASTYTLADTDRVTSWRNKYNATHDFTAAADARPTLVTGASGINGRPAIEFDGVDEVMMCTAPPLTSTGGSTVIVVANITAAAGSQSVFGQSDKDVDDRRLVLQGYQNPASDFVARFLVYNTGALNRYGTIELSGADVIVWRIGSSGEPSININRTADTVSSTSAISDFGDIVDTDNACVGAYLRNAGSGVEYISFLDGKIAEIMAWNECLTETPLQKVTTYLINKYGTI